MEGNLDEAGQLTQLRAEVERLRSIFSKTTESIWCWELVRPMPLELPPDEQLAWLRDAHLVECNPAAAIAYGYEHPSEVLGKHWSEVWLQPPRGVELLMRRLIEASYVLQDAKITVGYPDGSERIHENDVFPVVEGDKLLRLWGTARDVTARIQLEEELLQAQKLDVAGRLAGAVAHDFNNYLTAIISGLELLREHPNNQKFLETALTAAERSAELTRRLLGWSRQQITHRRPIVIEHVVGRLEPVLHRLLAPDVQLSLTLAGEGAAAKLDEIHLEQLVLNLVVNAAHAARDELRSDNPKPGANIVGLTVETDDSEVRLTVSDAGPGMTEELRERAFEPFFTTKQRGEGTGLGLDTVRRIVEGASGRIELDTAPGKGCRVHVGLPRCKRQSLRPLPPSLREAQGQARRVVVVDDEPTVRSLMGQTLRGAGYDAREYDSARPALGELVGAEGHEVALVVTDVQMRDVSGPEMIRALRATRPVLPVLFVSGYSRETLELPDEPQTSFLPKPFGRQALLDAVQQLLDRAVLKA